MCFIALASAALPLGKIAIKFDWLGACIIIMIGSVLFLNGKKINTGIGIYVVIFIVWLVINSLISLLHLNSEYDFVGFKSYFLQFIMALLTFLIISNLKLKSESVRMAMIFWVYISCAAGVLAICQVFFGDLIIDKYLYVPYYENESISKKVITGVLVPTAWFSEASWLSSFLVVPFIFVLFEIIGDRKPKEYMAVYYVQLMILALTLFLAFSLTAILSIIVGLIVMFILSAKSRVPIYLSVLLVIAVFIFSDSDRVILHMLRFTELIKNVFDYSSGSQYYGTTTSFYVRSVGFSEGLNLFLENFIAGIGIGQGGRAFHSGFITLLAEQGIIGAIIFFFPLVWVVSKLRRIVKFGDSQVGYLAKFFIIALLADYTNGLVTHHSFHLQRWLLISIAYSWVFALYEVKVSCSQNFGSYVK